MKMLETPKFVGFGKKKEMTFAYRYKKNILVIAERTKLTTQ
jgi:hypothetical protein